MAYKAYDFHSPNCNSYMKRKPGPPGSKFSIWPSISRSFPPKSQRSYRSNKNHWSYEWFQFLKISFAINFFSIFNLKYKLGIHFPSKTTMEKILLKIPSLCRSTVVYTVDVIYRKTSCLFGTFCPHLLAFQSILLLFLYLHVVFVTIILLS